MIKELKNYILNGDFEKAKEICVGINYKILEEELLEIAFDTNDISVYFFAVDLAYKKEEAELYAIASTLMSVVFNYLPGGYYLAYDHMLKASQLEMEDYTYKEGLLLFYHIPEKILTLKEALKIAKEIISICPDNKAAKSIINDEE